MQYDWPRAFILAISQESDFSHEEDLCKNTAINIKNRIFSENPALSCTTPHGPLTPCCISEKTNDPIPRKCLNGRTEGLKDRQTLIYGLLS